MRVRALVYDEVAAPWIASQYLLREILVYVSESTEAVIITDCHTARICDYRGNVAPQIPQAGPREQVSRAEQIRDMDLYRRQDEAVADHCHSYCQ